MPDNLLSNLSIEELYLDKTQKSKELSELALEYLPSGITHDSRHMKPYGIYIDRAQGPHKWDVDGNKYIDFFGGHGALLLGHCHPSVVRATEAAMGAGTQFGANHPREIDWAKQVIKMVPCAEKVRFTSSGTEATLMALRLARAFTGKNKIIRFKTHFHGWHDHMTSGYASHFEGTPTVGVLDGIASETILVDPQDISEVSEALSSHRDIAAVICEPTGSSFGMVPMNAEFCMSLREMTAKNNVLLIFDEVVTGFRCSPGGAQSAYGVTPDLATFAKILAGGLPGGAVAGRREILGHLDFDEAAKSQREKIAHPGTFNANPVSAAAGLAALKIIEDGRPNQKANSSADWLKQSFNETLSRFNVPWAAYGSFSGVHLFLNPENREIEPHKFNPSEIHFKELKNKPSDLVAKIRKGMLIHGVDFNSSPGIQTSSAHAQEDLEATAEAFELCVGMLVAQGVAS